jgi:hypothetical protein
VAIYSVAEEGQVKRLEETVCQCDGEKGATRFSDLSFGQTDDIDRILANRAELL